MDERFYIRVYLWRQRILNSFEILLQVEERETVELYDNRIALYIAPKGKCPISGQEWFRNHHIHHKQKWFITHDDSYNNLVLVIPEIYELIHATNGELIDERLSRFKIDKEHLEKLNEFCILVGKEINGTPCAVKVARTIWSRKKVEHLRCNKGWGLEEQYLSYLLISSFTYWH